MGVSTGGIAELLYDGPTCLSTQKDFSWWAQPDFIDLLSKADPHPHRGPDQKLRTHTHQLHFGPHPPSCLRGSDRVSSSFGPGMSIVSPTFPALQLKLNQVLDEAYGEG
jgi:hypothetical protein